MKLVLIKSGFRNKTTAALFGMNWQLLNNRPILYKKENFVLFSVYSVYYGICKDKTGPAGGLTVKSGG